ncbi:MAG: TIGR01440 family protein [Actinomycetaceae bacterium]|nr:TIGR01440 family protein [Actinomycetaceae bacterium]MDY6082928.1 TIGR01440 family protein [Actinomycetaceae bacterium]
MAELALDMERISQQAHEAVVELLAQASFTREGDFFVLGSSTSEVRGEMIGQGSSQEIGRAIIAGIASEVKDHGLFLAVQGCEHINRALSIDASALDAHRELEVVSVVPSLHAGGATSMAAWEYFESPLCVEHIQASVGLDIGDTEIGMHIRFVQKPIRLTNNQVGQARATALIYRPKLVGGSRATYERTF